MQKTLSLLFVFLLSWSLSAMAAVTNPTAVTDLLNRIGGSGTSDRFVTIVDETLKSNGKDVFTITAQDGKPCIKGSSTLAVTTGINWYLNHDAHVNLSWNNLTTDLSGVTLLVPSAEETHTCQADYRYYLNYCTFSYSMSTWTWDRWQKEIDWMALHGINMPLQIVGLDVVWKRLLTENYGYTSDEANAFIAGPSFQAWWGMNNLEGWGGPNPDWWYTREASLAKNICDRMRELGMQPVLPGFSGMVPSNFTTKTGIASNTQSQWCYFTRPYILDPSSTAFSEMAAKYYSILKDVMGTSKYYSMDPFHEGANVDGIDVGGAYTAIYNAMKAANSDIDEKWVIQYWQWSSAQYNVLNKVPVGDLIVLDLFSDGHTHFGDYKGHDAIYCMLDNFGGRTGFFGRLNGVINGYFDMKSQYSNIKGIGATPEGIEQVPVLYDALYELPWRDSKPDPQTWLADYAVSRYGTDNADAKAAWELLRNSSLNCTSALQGPMEGVLCARPALQVGSVSSWGGTGIFYDAQDVARAAAKLLGAGLSGDNYGYDVADLSRQALTDYSYYLLQGINAAKTAGNTELFNKRKNAFLQLILDLDELLNTNSMLQLGRWTQMARSIADEATGTTTSDKDWLELNNARTLISTWGDRVNANSGGLCDYSYRMWAGMMKDYYYPRWKTFFDNNCEGTDWFDMEWAWAHDASKQYSNTPTGSTVDVANTLFSKYFFPITLDNGKKFYAYRTIDNDVRTTYCPTVNRGSNLDLGLTAPDGVTATLQVDLNGDGAFGDGESFSSLTAAAIPSTSTTGKVKSQVSLSDGTTLDFNVLLKDNITTDRTVAVQTADAAQGTAALKNGGTSVTDKDEVTIVATPASGYDFLNWTDAGGNVVSTDAEYTYYGAPAATFTAHFVINKWGVPDSDTGDMNDIKSYNQYIKSITVQQYGGDAEEIYSASACPDQLYNVATKMVNAAPGSTFTINWTDAGGLQYTYLSAYIDLNGDGEFNTSDELLTVKGTHNSTSSAATAGPLTVTLPFDMPEGLTHLRLRFDGAWKTGYDATTNAFPAKNTMNRMCYEILVNVESPAKKAVTVSVVSGNEKLGTVDANGQSSTYTYPVGDEVILRCYPQPGCSINYWKDQLGRHLPASWMDGNMIKFKPYDNATITAVFTANTTVTYNDWTFSYEELADKAYITGVVTEGSATDLDMTTTNSAGKDLIGIAPGVLTGNTKLTSLKLPASCIYLDHTSASLAGAGERDKQIANAGTIRQGVPFSLKLTATTDGSSYNEWGTSLLATGTNSFADDYTGGFQLYWKKAGTLTAKVNGSSETSFSTTASSTFTIDMDYDGTNVTLKLTADDKDPEVKTIQNVTFNDISTFCCSLPTGINITSLMITDPTLHSHPFKGCTSMLNFSVADGNKAFSSVDGNLLSKDGSSMLAYAEGKLYKRAYILTNAADGQVVTSNPPTDTEGSLIADNYNGDQRHISTASGVTPASLIRLEKVDDNTKIYHYNSGSFFGRLNDDGTVGQQIEMVNSHVWSGSYTVNQRSYWDTSLSSAVDLKCSDYYLSGADSKFSLTSTEPADGNACVWNLSEVKQLTVNIGSALWTAVCFPVDVVIPAGVTAYTVERMTSPEVLQLATVAEGTVVKAGEAFLLSAEAAGPVTFNISYDGTATELSGNLLSGATARRTGFTAETFYGLGNKDGVAFYLSVGTAVPANKAYLETSKLGSTASKALRFVAPTGISDATTTEPAADVIYYDLRGRKVQNPAHGIFVTSTGKKVYIK